MLLSGTSGSKTKGLELFTKKFYEGISESDRQYRQFVTKQNKMSIGVGAGDTVSVSILGDLTVDGLNLTEGVDTPILDIEIGKQSCVVEEYGVKIIYSDKLQSMAELPIEDIFRKKLGRHAAMKMDLVAFNKIFNVANVVAAPKAGALTTDVSFSINGVSPNANVATDLSIDHVLKIATFMKQRRFPLRDGKYFAIGSPAALANIKKALTEIVKFTNLDTFYRGVIGEVYGVVFIEQTNILTKDVHFCGDDVGYEVVVKPEMIYYGTELDLGRRLEIGWKALIGHSKIMDNRIVKFDGNPTLDLSAPTYP